MKSTRRTDWKWLAHSKSFSSRSIQDTAKNQEGEGKARSCPSLSVRSFLPSLRRRACTQSALKAGRPGHLSESIRGEGDGELAGQQACVTVDTGPRSQANWAQGPLGAGQGRATAHDALGAPQKEAQGVSCFLCGKGGSLGGVHSWRLQARGLTGRRAPGVGAPGDRSRLGVPTPVPTPGRHDKLIVTPFPSPCGAPGSTQPVQETDTRGETRFLS